MGSKPHLILGTGPVGCWIATELRTRTIEVRAVNRSGKRPPMMPSETEVVAANIADVQEAIAVARDASVIYQAMNPPYHEWPKYFPGLQAGALAAAKATGARYVSIENLYMYDTAPPITEQSRVSPRSTKGVLRAAMADELRSAHERGEVQVTSLRSSDYYGPGVRASAMGERVFGPLLDHGKPQLLGSADTPHSFAYIEDVGRAAVTIAMRDEALGKVWIAPHAPPVTQGEIVRMACALLGTTPSYSVLSATMLRMAGIFIPGARANVEMMYEFVEPFIVDSSMINATFGLQPTPLAEGVRETLDWYRVNA